MEWVKKKLTVTRFLETKYYPKACKLPKWKKMKTSKKLCEIDNYFTPCNKYWGKLSFNKFVLCIDKSIFFIPYSQTFVDTMTSGRLVVRYLFSWCVLNLVNSICTQTRPNCNTKSICLAKHVIQPNTFYTFCSFQSRFFGDLDL